MKIDKTDTPYFAIYEATEGDQEIKLLEALGQSTKDMTNETKHTAILTFLKSIHTEDKDIKQYVSSMLSATRQLISIRQRAQLENSITKFFNP